jgi:uncharacterized protein YdeI (YjbR/CyaY-like superfamily)
MKPTFFASQDEFRKWLEKNHETANELLVGFWKVGTGKPSMTWSESVDQALCFGWIDGVRKRYFPDQDTTTPSAETAATPHHPAGKTGTPPLKGVELSEAYTIRFTPRRAKSVWSAINIAKVEELTKKGLMRPAGHAAYAKKDDKRAVIYAYENRPREFEPEYEKRFKKNKKAWEFFRSQAPSYQRTLIYWVMSAKQEATRNSRLEKLIEASKNKNRLL